MVKQLLRGSTFKAFIWFYVAFLGVYFMLGNDAIKFLDACAIAAGLAVVLRFGPAAWRAARKAEIRGEYEWVVGGVLVALSIVLIRCLRVVGIELGIIETAPVAFAFASITVLMVFGLFLKAVSLPLGDKQLTPYATIPVALLSGAGLAAFLWFLRWVF
jgi:hypothetical protein